MKPHTLTTTITLVAMLTTAAFAQQKTVNNAPTPSPATLYQAGINAKNQGDIANAEKYLKAAHAAKHPHAAFQLGLLTANRAAILGKNRQRALSTIRIEKIDFEDATVSECLDFITAAAKKQKPDFAPNFVLRDPKKSFAEKTITLELSNVPATAVLDFILSTAEATATYQEHAILIRPTN